MFITVSLFGEYRKYARENEFRMELPEGGGGEVGHPGDAVALGACGWEAGDARSGIA
jgi:hypothetical protein